MKVLTIREPWASLIINGYKEYEFRSWKTNYRGKILIHAGKGIDKGRLLASGNHEELLKNCDVYKNLYLTEDLNS